MTWLCSYGWMGWRLASVAGHVRAHEVTQRGLVHLSRRGQRERRNDLDTLGPLVLGESVALQIRAKLGQARRGMAIAKNQDGAETLVHHRTGIRPAGARAPPRVPPARRLDLFAVNLFPAAAHQVLEPAAEDVIRLAVDDLRLHQVARPVEPVARERFAIAVLGAVVAVR